MRILCVFIASFFLSTASVADITSEQWQRFSYGAAKFHVSSAYGKLKTKSSDLFEKASAHCDSPSESSLEATRQAFHEVMDAWQGIQHIRFGPIEIMMRGFDMQYWPDKKNYTGKELSKLIAARDVSIVESDKFYKLSVSVKGLPAIERLLFDDAHADSVAKAGFECGLLKRISEHVFDMSYGLSAEWDKEMLPAFTEFGEDAYFYDQKEAATSVLKGLIEPIEVISDLKLKRPLGENKAKYKRLESWRSERSLRNIKVNIDSLRALYSGQYLQGLTPAQKESNLSLSSLLDESWKLRIDKAFSKVSTSISAFDQSIEKEIVTKKGRTKTLELIAALKELRRLLEDAVSEKGIHLGFNSRDGD